MQYLSPTFQERMQALFLRRWQETKSKRTHILHFWNFSSGTRKKDRKVLRYTLPTF